MTIDALKAVKSFADAALATTPAKNDPMMNAFTLYRVVSTPIASAAI